ncbi:carboxy methyl transferase for protein phosphatase 2A [Coemansia helicoidea]|uniref:Carboxy methyl transferase for protein phosphatase 2A n=1 Tax=Coemansia helicoidea TaxID=1286919 RepID=A0ACC1L6K6_9FUNG|nr:carboxy methyl transferase for protein phosphatase 2A [Coemansia helicoidea]
MEICSSDAAVQGTSNDAAVSRESAARLGYIDDPFIQYFVRRPQRRAPLINRGTHSRFDGVQRILRQFAARAAGCGQVVVLGAGLDTSYFLLRREGPVPLRYFEVDFAEVTAKKAATLWRTAALRTLLPEDAAVAGGGTEVHSNTYNLVAGDLRRFEAEVVPTLAARGLDTAAPTLFVSECVLVYLGAEDSDALIDWITWAVPNAGIVTYEQIRPDDRFGQMMVANLRARGLELHGLHAYPTLDAAARRFLERGWHAARALDLAEYHERLRPEERARLSEIEILDEWEEFTLLAQHYAFAFAHTAAAGPFDAMGFDQQ